MLRTYMLALLAVSAAAQTRVDLRTQAKAVDFTSAASTRPVKTGTELPATCTPGDLFFKTDAPAGANLYGCASTNKWSVEGGISSESCRVDTDLMLKCQDASGNLYAVVKTSSSAAANEWVDYIAATGIPHTSRPTASAVGAVGDPGANGVPYRTGAGTATPASASQLSGAFFCQDTGGTSAYACNLEPAIAAYTAGTTYWFRANTANSGAATINFNGLGAKPVRKQADQELAAGDIRAGQWVMLTYDGTNMQMQSQTGNAPASGVATIFGRSGAVTAQSGDYTTAQVAESGNLYFTEARARAALRWTLPVTFDSSTGTIACPTCLTTAAAADTDLSGSFPHLSVVAMQGRRVANTSPADQQYLGWNNTASQWEPRTLPLASVFGRTGAVTAQTGDYTTAQVAESGNLYFTNARARAALSATAPVTFSSTTGAIACPTCITSSTAADTDLSGSFPHLSVTRIAGRTVATAQPADLQYLGWNSGASQWEPKTLPGPPVSSVFGRAGSITAQAGDYAFSQIWGTLAGSQLPAVAMRTDSDNTVTAGTQDMRKAAHTYPMKTGLTADLPNACEAGETYFATDGPAGSNLYGCTTTNTWTVQGHVTVKTGGTEVGTTRNLNFLAGTGLISFSSVSGTDVNMEWALDTAVVQTQPGEQSGAALFCASASGSGNAYTCGLNPPAIEYTSGMVLHWRPDLAGAGGATTLNVDTLGAVPVKLADGTSDPTAADIAAGQLYNLWYDGASFRLTGGTSGGGIGTADANTAGAAFSCQDTGTSSAYACNLDPAITEYGTGAVYWFKANTANDGPATIEFNSLGAKAIKKLTDVSLAAGDIHAGQWVMLTYDGTNMQMQSPATGSECPNCITSSTAADTDLSGTFPHLSVVKLQGRTVAATSPADLQYLGWNNAAAQWEPMTLANSGTSALPAHAATHASAGSDPIGPAAIGAEPSIAAGTSGQFWGWDKTWRSVADEVGTATPAANAIPKAGETGKLAQGWIDFTGYQPALGFTPADSAKVGQANGIASLDANGAVPVGQLPASARVDTSVVADADDFTCGEGGGSSNVSCLNWNIYGTGASNGGGPSAFPHLGVYRLAVTNSSTSNYSQMTAASSNIDNSFGSIGALASSTAGTWEFHWIFRLNQTTNVKCYLGLAYGASTGYLTGLRFDTSLGDTGFLAVTHAGTTASLASADTNWHHLKVRHVAMNTIGMSLDGGTERTACGSGCDIAIQWSDFNSWSAIPIMMVGPASEPAANTLDVDYFGYYLKVGAR